MLKSTTILLLRPMLYINVVDTNKLSLDQIADK